MNAYEEKQQRRRAYYEAKAQQAENASNAEYDRFKEMGSRIPFGQPILVGHHSEKSDRAYRSRMCGHMDKSIALMDKADYYRQKAESVGRAGISSDDPDAVKKLAAKLADLKNKQALMKSVNKALRLKNKEKGDTVLLALGLTKEQVETLHTPDELGRVGFPSYALTNNNANIRRVANRLKMLKKATESQAKSEDIETPLYTFHVAENRVQFLFDGKPKQEVRDILKGWAFRWSPSRGAWVRQATANGLYAAKMVRKQLDALEKE